LSPDVVGPDEDNLQQCQSTVEPRAACRSQRKSSL